MWIDNLFFNLIYLFYNVKKRTILSAEQKYELYETKEKNPTISNVCLVQKYNIGKLTVTDILNKKERKFVILED